MVSERYIKVKQWFRSEHNDVIHEDHQTRIFTFYQKTLLIISLKAVKNFFYYNKSMKSITLLMLMKLSSLKNSMDHRLNSEY